MASGLDSIALAVAHLEREEKNTGTASHRLPPPSSSLFLNHARVVSTDRLEAAAVVASNSPTATSLLVYSSVAAVEQHQPWKNHCAVAPPIAHSLATMPHPHNHTAFSLPLHAISHHAEHRNPSTFNNNNMNNNKKKKPPISAALTASITPQVPPQQHKQYKNLLLYFEMAPYPIPKDILLNTSTNAQDIQDDDVLLGRGGETNHHAGNVQYRRLVKACQPAYLAAKRRDKPRIAAGIVLAVRRVGGRFLKKDDHGVWADVGNVRAREKTSQALREGAPDLRPKSSVSSSSSSS